MSAVEEAAKVLGDKSLTLGPIAAWQLAKALAEAGLLRVDGETGPGSFWTQTEWAEWSNDLATLIPEGDESRYSNPEGAQEGIIEDCLRAYVAERTEVPSCPGCGESHDDGPRDSDGRDWCGECVRDGVPS